MTTLEQIDEFSAFARQLVEREGANLPLEVIFDRWHEEAHRKDDLARIRASVVDFENGLRGRPLEEFLGEFKAQDLSQR